MFQWTTDLKVDGGHIDDDHRELFNIANRVSALDPENLDLAVLRSTVKDLYTYIEYHFSREEDFMRSIDYPQIDIHHQIHQDILKEMNVHLTESRDETELVRVFKSFLQRWILDHIMEEDLQIARFLEYST